MLDFDLLGDKVEALLATPLRDTNQCDLVVFPEADFEPARQGRSRKTVLFTIASQSWSSVSGAAALSHMGHAPQPTSLDMSFYISSFSLRGPSGVYAIANTIYDTLSGLQLADNWGRAIPQSFRFSTRDDAWQWLYDFSWSISALEARPGINAQHGDGLPIIMFP